MVHTYTCTRVQRHESRMHRTDHRGAQKNARRTLPGLLSTHQVTSTSCFASFFLLLLAAWDCEMSVWWSCVARESGRTDVPCTAFSRDRFTCCRFPHQKSAELDGIPCAMYTRKVDFMTQFYASQKQNWMLSPALCLCNRSFHAHTCQNPNDTLHICG